MNMEKEYGYLGQLGDRTAIELAERWNWDDREESRMTVISGLGN